MKASPTSNSFRVGQTIEFDDSVWRVLEFMHVNPGKGAAFVRRWVSQGLADLDKKNISKHISCS